MAQNVGQCGSTRHVAAKSCARTAHEPNVQISSSAFCVQTGRTTLDTVHYRQAERHAPVSNSHRSLKGVGERSAPPKQMILLPMLAIAWPPRAAGAEAPRSNCKVSYVFYLYIVHRGMSDSGLKRRHSPPLAGSTHPCKASLVK